MKTRAAVLRQTGSPLEIEELTLPDLKWGQVLVAITCSGVCHSQINEIRGLKGEDRYLPHTLGHEGSGIVEAVGRGVEKVGPGDHVVLTWIRGKGAEVPSTTYQDGKDAAVNSGAISTFMERAIVSENRLVVLPREMPLREAALLGCAIPTGAGIVMNSAQIQPGDSIAVFGIGGVGLSAVVAAGIRKAAMTIAIDVVDYKLEQACDMGATHVINASQQDPLALLLEITNGRGVDCAIEAAGRRETMELAFQAVRDSGGLCVLAGNLPHGERICLDPFDLIRGKRIVGTWGGETQPDRDIPLYVDLYLSGELGALETMAQVYSLDDVNRAIEDLGAGRVIRPLISMSGS
jgi:S-(hydroxymethyl)glutathione dehydrogenase/alcohol dehydrogenase